MTTGRANVKEATGHRIVARRVALDGGDWMKDNLDQKLGALHFSEKIFLALSDNLLMEI